ncbi:MAG: SH3 domain-containing protein [Spirochaetes bacterium]|nr:SH3 domain-containing protein [Spirochaetota bacterium]
MKLKFISSLVCICFLISCSNKDEKQAKPETVSPWIGRVTAYKLIIRKAPDQKSGIAGTVLKHHRIDVLEVLYKKETINGISSSWFKVKTESGLEGFAFGGDIEKPENDIDLPVYKSELLRCPDDIHNSYKCVEYIEKRLLPGLKDNVKRNGNTLTIRCSNGKVVEFTDENSETDQYMGYLLRHHYKIPNLYLIFIQYYEGGEYYILNSAGGEQEKIWDVPVFSPDNTRFICTSEDLEAGYGYTGIQVFRIENSKFIKEYEVKLQWGPSHPVWVNNNKINLVRNEYIDLRERTSPDKRYLKFRAELELVDGKWILNE